MKNLKTIEEFLNESKNNMKVFLGGTCNDSKWRDELIEMLDIEYFNPVIEDWNEEAEKQEVKERKTCDHCLYVITPKMKGVFSIAEVIDDSNKRPDKTIFAILDKDGDLEFEDFQVKSLNEVFKMVKNNGGNVFRSLEDIAGYLNKNNDK